MKIAHFRFVTLLAIALATAGPSSSADVSASLLERLAQRGTVPAVLYFHDREPATEASPEHVVQRLQRNLEDSQPSGRTDEHKCSSRFWNRTRAARLLGISRRGLHTKIAAHGLADAPGA